MKLSEDRIDAILTQLPGQVVPESSPATSQLIEVFGEHTFFVTERGLQVIEPAEGSAGNPTAGRVVKVAQWQDESRTNLVPHPPERTDIMVALDRAA